MICMLRMIHYFWLMFLSAPGLASKAALKKAEVKLELLTDIDMLLTVEKGIRGGICNTIIDMQKPKINL